MKTCTKCGARKPLTDFYKRRRGDREYPCPECKECAKARSRRYMREYAAINKARGNVVPPGSHTCSNCRRALPASAFSRHRSQKKGIQNICKQCFKLRRYELSTEDYEALLERQGGVCAICGDPCSRLPILCIDHDHNSGEVRGLLCTGCNLGLGAFGDDPEKLVAAAAYLLQRTDVLGMVR